MASGQQAVAYSHDIASGRGYPLCRGDLDRASGMTTNIVLDSNVSRHHAVIVDTGTNYVINDPDRPTACMCSTSEFRPRSR